MNFSDESKTLTAKQKAYNEDGASNQGEYSNYTTIHKAQKYVDVWERIKRNPTNVGVLNSRKLPNGDLIDKSGVYYKKSSCGTYLLQAS